MNLRRQLSVSWLSLRTNFKLLFTKFVRRLRVMISSNMRRTVRRND